jgi:hypothetical protein
MKNSDYLVLLLFLSIVTSTSEMNVYSPLLLEEKTFLSSAAKKQTDFKGRF